MKKKHLYKGLRIRSSNFLKSNMKVEINRRALAQWCFVLNLRLFVFLARGMPFGILFLEKNIYTRVSENGQVIFLKSNMKVEINRRALAQWCFVLNLRLFVFLARGRPFGILFLEWKKKHLYKGLRIRSSNFLKSNMKVEINRRALAQWCFVLNLRLFVFLARGMPFGILFLEKKHLYKGLRIRSSIFLNRIWKLKLTVGCLLSGALYWIFDCLSFLHAGCHLGFYS